MLGYTGVPRDMLAYVSIIWGTGIADLLQTLASIGFVILMGVFYYQVIDGSGLVVANHIHLQSGHPKVETKVMELKDATEVKSRSDPIIVILK